MDAITTEAPRTTSQPSPAAAPASRPRFIHSLVTVLGGQAVCGAVALAIEVCNARLLGPSGRGVVSLCGMAVTVFVLVASLGQEAPIVIWTADSKRREGNWLPAVFFWGTIGCAMGCGGWAYSYWVWHPRFLQGITPALALMVIAGIPVTTLLSYLVAMLMGQERFRARAALNLTTQVAEFCGILGLMWLFGRRPEMSVLGNLLGLLASALLAAWLLRRPLRGVWRVGNVGRNWGAALSLGVRGQPANLATFFNYRLDVFIVNYLLNPAQVGLYAVGVMASESLWQLPHAAATALFPRTARTIGAGADEFTCLVLRQVLLSACVLGVAMALASPVLIPLIFGADFTPSVAVIFWILPGTIALAAGKVMCADLAARGKVEHISLFALATLIVTVGLDLLLVPRMGIRGAALASSIAYLVDAALIAIALKWVLKVSWRQMLAPSKADWITYRQGIERWRQRRKTIAPGGRVACSIETERS